MSSNLPDLNITTISEVNRLLYDSTFETLKKRNKYVSFDNVDTSIVVNYNNMDIGVVCIKRVSDSTLNVSIYQLPNVCRVSVISLIEATLSYLKSLNNKDTMYSLFLEQSYYKSIVLVKAPVFKEVTDTNVIISSNHLNEKPSIQITCKNVIIS